MGWFLPALIGGLAAGTAGAAVGAGINAIGGSKKQNSDGSWTTVPESPEAVWAREKLGTTLKANETLPGYGAISPDWADIWQQATNKVKSYYYGDAFGGGAYANLKSKAAIGNMLNSPAYLRNVAKTQVEEGNTYKDLAGTEAINKANFSEQGRKDWMQGLETLSNNSPTQMYNSPSQGSDYSGLISGLANKGGELASSLAGKWAQNLFSQKAPTTFQPLNMPEINIPAPQIGIPAWQQMSYV